MYIVIGAVLIIAFLLACADRRHRQRVAYRRLMWSREQAATEGLSKILGEPWTYADYSGFDQDRILMNRSERW